MSEAEHPFPIVGIGASAGGLTALTSLIGALPSRPGLALVVIQHLDPLAESHLPELLQTHTAMTVVDATHSAKVAADCLFVIRPNTNVAIVDGMLSVTPRPGTRLPHYPIDHFFRSLAEVQGGRAVGVVLSGTGSDGTLGLCEIKASGGLTFAQDPQSAQHAGMPQSAVASGAIDMVLTPEQIAVHLATLAQHPYLNGSLVGALDHAHGHTDQFHRVISALHSTSGVDLSQYRDTTIRRRTARRMLLRGIKSPAEYAELIERDQGEADALYRDVLINVTSFFRDADVFAEMKRSIFPEIFTHKRKGEAVRAWVPGCSTGQEAYSVAISLLEYMDETHQRLPLQIFGTDMGDPAALERARAGLYPESIETEVSAERLARYFTKETGGYRVQRVVRDLCVFARQNLTVDPPFSRVDLITCRNVLIYMSPSLQHRLLPVFHFALNPGGYLVLGIAESVGQSVDLFDLVSQTHKIFRKRETDYQPLVRLMRSDWTTGIGARPPAPTHPPPLDYQREADRLVLGRYAPPSVLVNQDFEIQQFRGRTAPYLEVPTGQPTTNLMRLVKEGLFLDFRKALTEAKSNRTPVVREGLRVDDGGVERLFTLRVLPVTVPQATDFRLLVIFEPDEPGPASGAPAPRPSDRADLDEEVERLRLELTSTREYLQSIVEQQEGATQELRAAHEEVLSSNEELQSTNEELETMKEELQSSNEELTTVNEQLQQRNTELATTTTDLSNVIGSAGVPLVVVDRELHVRRITPAAELALNLFPADVGRSIAQINTRLDNDRICEMSRTAIEQGRGGEQELVDRDGRWWLLRVQPYLTAQGAIDGATVVAVDVDLVKRTLDVLEARDYALAIVQAVREPLVVLDESLRIGMANTAYCELCGVAAEEIPGQPFEETCGGLWKDRALRKALKDAVSGTALDEFELVRMLKDQGPRTLVLNARGITRPNRPPLVLLSIADVTERRQADALKLDAETLRRVDRRKDEFLGILAHELRNPLAPMRFAVEILRRAENDNPQTARARQVLDRQLTHMVRIVDDLLDVSRITQGKVELRRECVELKNVVSAAVDLCQPVIDAAGQDISISLPDEIVKLDADPVRLAQVLVNLLTNAAKFTPPGGHIWLMAETTGDQPEAPDLVRIRVRDSGIGIAPDLLPRIFDLFMQGDRSLERTRGGLGVGLTLVRSLVLLHGGSIQARSDGLGTGSEFTVTLPIDPAAQPAAARGDPSATLEPQQRLRILVADDNQDAREMLSFFLNEQGHEVTSVGDGASAIAAASEFKPEVAILDIGMPGLSGYDVATQLRTSSPPSLLLIALSGLGQEADRARAVAAGFNQHFTKPVDPHTLVSFLASRR
jgi:two-component system CheB/CheR fusion protein